MGCSTYLRLFGNGQESSGGGVIQSEEGSFLVVGGRSPSLEYGSIGGVMLMKVNKSGELLWQHTYGGEGYTL